MHGRFSDYSVSHPPAQPGEPQTVYVSLDSRSRNFATSPSAGRYRVRLPAVYHNVTSARLMMAEVPVSFYNFSAAQGNTTLRITLDGTPFDATIPDGNYTEVTLPAALKTALDAATSETFAVTVSPASLRMTIACSSAPTDVLTISTATTKPVDWGLAYNCGFVANATVSGVGSVTGTKAVDTVVHTYLLLSLEGLDHVGVAGMLGSGEPRRAFAKVPVRRAPGETIFFDKQLSANALNPPRKNLDTLWVTWTHADGTVVEWNGAEHSFEIELTCTDMNYY